MPSDTTNQPASDTDAPEIPWATVSVLIVLILIYMVQGETAQTPGWDLRVPDLIASGALNPDLAQICGEWWRVATAPLLHANPAHLLMNGIALFFAGRFIEVHLGGIVLCGMLAVGAVAGANASMLSGDDQLVSVGASGAIMALLAAALFLCYMLPEAADTISGRSLFLRILVPSMVPTHDGVDYAAHFGGACAGLLAVAAIRTLDDRLRATRLSRWLALLATIAYCGVAALGATRLIQTATARSPSSAYLALNATSKLLGQSVSEARKLVVDYPQDPQAHLVLSLALYDAGQPAESEREANAGLREVRLGNAALYELVTVPQLKAMIALGLAATGHGDRARDLASPICRAIETPFRDRLDQARLCA